MNSFCLFVIIWISGQNLRLPIFSQMKEKVEEVILRYAAGLKGLMNITAGLFLQMEQLSL